MPWLRTARSIFQTLQMPVGMLLEHFFTSDRPASLDKPPVLPYLSYSTHPNESSCVMAPDDRPDDHSFEDALNRLEEIVESLEDDPPSLEEALDTYEEGVELANECLSRLDDAEQRVSELSIDDNRS